MRYYSSTAVEMALTGSVNNLATTIVVGTAPAQPAQTPFTLVLDVGLSTEEIVTVTGVSGTTLTVTRGEDGSTAVAHSGGAVARHMMTARDLRDPATHVAAAANVHSIGATASVVGTDTPQTLTNKTLNFANNTVTGIPLAAVADLVDHIAATAAHGATGSVVGTTNAQTLTNKTLSDPVVTGPPSNIHNPVGTLLLWAGAGEGGGAAPDGYLLAYGTAISRTTYSALFAVIGTTYGAGDGSSTFNLPDINGRVVVGINFAQDEFNALGKAGGARTHLLTAAEMPSHTHVQDAHTHVQNAHTHSINTYASGASADGARVSSNGVAGAGVLAGTSATNATTATNNAATATNQNTGGGGAHNNLQPYIVLRYIIKF